MPADANSVSAFWIVAASSVICVLALEVGTYFAELPDGLVKMSSMGFFLLDKHNFHQHQKVPAACYAIYCTIARGTLHVGGLS